MVVFRNKAFALKSVMRHAAIYYFFFLWFLLGGACSHTPDPAPLTAKATLTLKNCAIKQVLETGKTSLGPIPFEVYKDHPLTIDRSNIVVADIFKPKSSPHNLPATVIFLHGNHSRKEAHFNQAAFAASWGFQALAIQFPNEKRWFNNGSAIAKYINKSLKTKNQPSDFNVIPTPNNIILIGHSFGATTATYAASLVKNQAITGLILLDPAMYKPRLVTSIKSIRAPTVILGADEKIFKSKKRPLFAKHLPSEVLEVSIAGATHDDAQFPSMFSIYAAGFDPYTSVEKQIYFRNLIAATLLSMTCSTESASGLRLQNLWDSLQPEITESKISRAKYKN